MNEATNADKLLGRNGEVVEADEMALPWEEAASGRGAAGPDHGRNSF